MSKTNNNISVIKPINDVLSGDFFKRKFVMKNLPFLAFLTGLIVLYIGYGYYVDRVMKKLAELENMEELNSELHSSIRELNQVSLQSNIIGLTKQKGLKELVESPVKMNQATQD